MGSLMCFYNSSFFVIINFFIKLLFILYIFSYVCIYWKGQVFTQFTEVFANVLDFLRCRYMVS